MSLSPEGEEMVTRLLAARREIDHEKPSPAQWTPAVLVTLCLAAASAVAMFVTAQNSVSHNRELILELKARVSSLEEKVFGHSK